MVVKLLIGICLALAAIWPVRSGSAPLVARMRGRCICGYSTLGLPTVGACPECGTSRHSKATPRIWLQSVCRFLLGMLLVAAGGIIGLPSCLSDSAFERLPLPLLLASLDESRSEQVWREGLQAATDTRSSSLSKWLGKTRACDAIHAGLPFRGDCIEWLPRLSRKADTQVRRAMLTAAGDRFSWNRHAAVRTMSRFSNSLEVFGEDLKAFAGGAADYGVQSEAILVLVQFKQDAPIRERLLRTLKDFQRERDDRSIALGLLSLPPEWRSELLPVLEQIAAESDDPLSPAIAEELKALRSEGGP